MEDAGHGRSQRGRVAEEPVAAAAVVADVAVVVAAVADVVDSATQQDLGYLYWLKASAVLDSEDAGRDARKLI